MSTTITLDTEGRLLLPEEWRNQLALKAGAKLRADLSGGKIQLVPEQSDTIALVNKKGMMVITGVAGPVNAVEAIAADREAREAAVISEVRP